ncbi:prepilin-type N-terminal cleavage/methylation domain-containing protein [Paenibacillus sp. FSL E2-0178]|uniref:type IV pilus modification PilV family protein n=1 Tax=Paenibacillus sp. FSL E2-0178 TaxID=2921361 RepID=UPI0031590966
MSWRDKWNRNRERGREEGFTLIEVLAAIVILSIVSLVLTSYFTNALSYSKSNQNKTIMVNLARNALFYMEKQDFEAMGNFFKVSDVTAAEHPKILADQCTDVAKVPCSYNGLVKDETVLQKVLNPSINGINYTINIAYQADLYSQMKLSEDVIKQRAADYLIPVLITVRSPEKNSGNATETVVEGYIRDEEIR